MRTSEFEEWALRVLARIDQGQRIEDSRIELKSAWIEPVKAARRIAGHANAALGEPILWLIGVGEDGSPTSPDFRELANWWPGVLAHLAPPLPSSQSLVVQWRDSSVVALLLDTSRAPYLFRNPSYGMQGGGPVELEVPWRTMTAVHTARHEELIRMLVPQSKLPAVEILKVSLFLSGPQDRRAGRNTEPVEGSQNRWNLDATVYFVNRQTVPVVLAGHKHTIKLRDPQLGELAFRPLHRGREFLVDVGDIVVDLPTRVEFDSYLETTDARQLSPGAELTFGFSLAGDHSKVSVACVLTKDGEWSFGQNAPTDSGVQT